MTECNYNLSGLPNNSVPDNTVVKIWLGLGTKTFWLGLGKDDGMG